MEDIKSSEHDKQIQNSLLKTAYEQRLQGWLPSNRLSRFSDLRLQLRPKELEFHLDQLASRKLLKTRSETITLEIPSLYGKKSEKAKNKVTYYHITDEGIKLVENDFKETEPHKTPNMQFNIFGDAFFGDVSITTINEIMEQEQLEQKLQIEIKVYFEQLKEELKSDYINRNKIKDLLGKIGQAGISELTKAAISMLINYFIRS